MSQSVAFVVILCQGSVKKHQVLLELPVKRSVLAQHPSTH